MGLTSLDTWRSEGTEGLLRVYAIWLPLALGLFFISESYHSNVSEFTYTVPFGQLCRRSLAPSLILTAIVAIVAGWRRLTQRLYDRSMWRNLDVPEQFSRRRIEPGPGGSQIPQTPRVLCRGLVLCLRGLFRLPLGSYADRSAHFVGVPALPCDRCLKCHFA